MDLIDFEFSFELIILNEPVLKTKNTRSTSAEENGVTSRTKDSFECLSTSRFSSLPKQKYAAIQLP